MVSTPIASSSPESYAQRLRGHRFAAVRSALGKVVHWHHRIFDRRRLEAVAIERIEDQPLLVLPGVLNPKLMRTGAFFASVVRRDLRVWGAEVLDLGTGSGVCAVVAARRARKVVAVDLNPAAVRCALINALVAGLEDKIEVLQGDLFAPVKDRRFDLVLFNPPFLRGVPRDLADLAWRSTDVAERFAAGLDAHLAPEGSALLLLSTFGDAAAFLAALVAAGFAITLDAEREFLNERLFLFAVRRPFDAVVCARETVP